MGTPCLLAASVSGLSTSGCFTPPARADCEERMQSCFLVLGAHNAGVFAVGIFALCCLGKYTLPSTFTIARKWVQEWESKPQTLLLFLLIF